MKIVRIVGARRTGKSTALESFIKAADMAGSGVFNLTGKDLPAVQEKLDWLANYHGRQGFTTFIVDECTVLVERALEDAQIDDAFAVIAHLPRAVAPPDKAGVMNLAHHLTQVAAQAGLIVTIERLPLKPLAMGNCCYEIATYPVRGAQ